MRRIGSLLIVLGAILSFGCAPRGDWISETLTLVDVSGTWEGTIRGTQGGSGRSIRLVLRQRGAKVTGELEGGGAFFGLGKNLDGLVNGDVFTFQVAAFRGEVTVDGVEMNGRGTGSAGGPGSLCPCFFVLRRIGKSADER